MKKMTTREQLLATAAVIEERGLARRTVENMDGKVCLMGGFNLAVNGHVSLPYDEAEVTAFIEAMGFTYLYQAIAWNDRWWRTQASVIRRLNQAADQLLPEPVTIPQGEPITITRKVRV